MDPTKLKVVELRLELANRGLDQKGVKAVLIERLQEALDAEKNAESPASNADSSESGENEAPIEAVEQIDSKTCAEKEVNKATIEESSKSQSEVPQPPADVAQPKAEDPKPDVLEPEPKPVVLEPEPKPHVVEPVIEKSEDKSPIRNQFAAVTENVQKEENESSTIGDQQSETKHQEAKTAEVTSVEANASTEITIESTPLENNQDIEMEVDSEKNRVAIEAKVESGDDDKRSVTQSEDNKRGEGESDSDRKDRKRRRSRSKSSSPAAKRSRRPSPIQNTDDFTNDEDEPEIDDNTVLLSWFDSDLNLKVNSSEFLSARPISEGPLAMAWAGVRASHGVRNGKVSYEVFIDDVNRVHGLSYERNLHEVRCGWSVKTTSLQLGETPLSFGYGGSGKKSSNNEFTEYGCKFKERDVVGVYLDLESTPCKIEYTVNGESQGVAFEFDKSELGEEALYPHILTKNTGFKVNFGQMEKSFVSKIKPKARRDERRDSRRDRRSDRDSKRDRTRSRSRSRDESKKDRSEETEKAMSKNEKSVEDGGEHPTNNDKAEEVMKMDVCEDASIAEEKVEQKSTIPEQLENPVDVSETTKDPIGENQSNDTKEDSSTVPSEKTMLSGYEFIGKLPIDQLVVGFTRPESRKDCEVILLIGLPGSGKSHWAKNVVSENVEKHYNILGLQPLLAKMTISGEPRKKHAEGKWDRFVDSCIRGVNIIQDIANKRRRNYIIDQTNVISSVQRRKIKGFGDFKRIAVVFIPDDDEHKQRLEKKLENEGKEVSEYSTDDMKANFSIPNSGCWFDEIQFVGLEEEEAKKKVLEYNEQGKKALSAHPSAHSRGSRDYNRKRRDDFRDNRDRDRRWGNDRRDNRSDWRSTQGWRGGGGGGYDRRDRWQGGGGGNWMSNYRGNSGNSRYDDRYRGNSGYSGYSRHRDFGHDRDRRDDRRNENRSDRDFRDGNRERRFEDKRRHDRGVPQREKDEKQLSKQQPSQNYKSTKADPPVQGHWNPNVVGPQANNWNNYYQQQNWGEYNQQQNWGQWNQQQGQQPNNYPNNQTQQQDWSNWPQQTTQEPPSQQQEAPQGGWQNWTQHAQTYANAGDQTPAPTK